MLNLGLNKKSFKMEHLNIQGIQIKVEQIDLTLNSSENDIQLLGLSESKLNANHPITFLKSRVFSFSAETGLYQLIDLNKVEE